MTDAKTQIQPFMIMGAAMGVMDNVFSKLPKYRKSKRNFHIPPNYKFKHTGKNRNKPCQCGSGKKFKRCCWDLIK